MNLKTKIWLTLGLGVCFGLWLQAFAARRTSPKPQSNSGASNTMIYESVNRPIKASEIDTSARIAQNSPLLTSVPTKAQLVCSLYGEASQGGNAFFRALRCPIPVDFPLDRSYHQAALEGRCTGGGATSPLQPADIPAGYHIVCDGGYYWAVLPPIDQVAMSIGQDGTVHQWALDVPMYCGPGASGQGGCNVKVYVYAVRR
jgi:hypothetical protein